MLRTCLILVFLAVSGYGFSILTASRSVVIPVAKEKVESELVDVRFFLSFSAAAERVLVNGEELGAAAGVEYSGMVGLEVANPVVFLEVEWAAESIGRRFAKLTLEVPGRETLRHVFDGDGDLDDFFELPWKL